MKTQKNISHSVFACKRGSILLTAVIFSTISLVTIASFLTLTSHELRLANTQFYTNQSLNLAEAGMDEAMHLVNFENDQDWDVSGGNARLSVRNVPIGRGATGEFDVLVEDWEGQPKITSEGRVTGGSGLTSTKQLQATLRPRSYFANGLTARCEIRFAGGNSAVESYRSSTAPVGSTNPPYVKRDQVAVATTKFENDSLDIGNGFIWGYAFTGGGAVNVGPHGTVQGEGSSPLPRVDPRRVARDFEAVFPRAVAPPGSPTSPPPVYLDLLEDWIDEKINVAPRPVSEYRTADHYIEPGNLALVRAGQEAVHKTEYGTISSSTIIGVPKGSMEGATPPVPSPLVVYVDSINMNGGEIVIVGPVVMVVKGDVKFAGGAELVIGFEQDNNEQAALLMYAYKDVSFSGNGGMENNTRYPNNLAIFGMADETDCDKATQIFDLGGNANWEALVYAPNARVTLNGGGNGGYMAGAVVGLSIRINGGSMFHYDEDTDAFLRGFGFAMASWKEIRKIDRISFN